VQILRNNPEILRIFEAATPFEECDFIVSDIKRRVMAGERFCDFAIIARSLESYSGILDTSLLKAGVPHFFASPRSINSFEAIKLITTAYSAITRRFAMADVVTYVKCGLIGATRDECDLFEMYVTKWNISGSRFTDGMLWNMNPRGYEAFKEGDSEKLVRINEIREKIMTPLRELADRSKDAKTVRDHAEALLDFLIEIDLEGKLDERARELAALGETDAAEQNSRLWRIICDSLDTLVDVLGELPADAESFINQLSVIFTDTNMGSIPSYHDEVSVGRADMVRLRDKKHVYLIGVNAGEFPKTVSDNSYFTDRDKATLAKLGLGVTPDLEVKNARELYSFSRSFSFAKRSVTLIYTVKTASLGSALPSEAVARIVEITDKAVKPVSVSDIPLMDKIYSPELALENLGKANAAEKAAIKNALGDTEYRDVLAVSEGKLENDDVTIDKEAIGIIVGKDIYLSQSKIDKYLKCPFRYFSQYFLDIDENDKAEINQLVVGNFIHSVLENTFGEVMKDGRSIADLTPEEREKITARSAKAYIEREIGGAGSAKNEVIIERINRVARPIVEGLCDEFANCRFTPVQCEMRIDAFSKDTPDSIIYAAEDKKHRVIIGGYIDRLDTVKIGNDVYVRVIDYKTGIKEFSLDDVKKGENLQMLLYLKSVTETERPEFLEKLGVEEGGKLLPAGIVYVKTSVADVTIDSPSDELAELEVKATYERLGASLDSEEVLAAMNPDFTPMAKTRKGDVPKPQTYSMEDWKRINDEMKDAVLSIADEITSGHIVAKTNVSDNSSFHPCENCQYKFICRNAVK
jgi:ATP-dependent helicase/nuclease subunit B